MSSLDTDALATILARLRTLERKIDQIRNRRRSAQKRQDRERTRSPIHRKALELLTNPEAAGHTPINELRTFLHLDFPRRSVYRYIKKIEAGAFRPRVYIYEGEVFYDAE